LLTIGRADKHPGIYNRGNTSKNNKYKNQWYFMEENRLNCYKTNAYLREYQENQSDKNTNIKPSVILIADHKIIKVRFKWNTKSQR